MPSSADAKAARRAKFEAVFEQIRDELIGHFASLGMPQEAVDWYRDNLNYNTPGGKLNRGMSVVDTVEILKNGAGLTDEAYFKAAVLGWCVELLQAYFLVADDMMDGSITRRSQPCWYRKPEVGMIAINDAFMLEGAIYQLLKTHFRREAYYVDLLEVFHETTYQTEIGQLVDLITAPEDKVDLNKFSLERHRLIVLYKTAYYSFYLPVACAMLVAGIPESQTSPSGAQLRPYDIASSILLPLGEYFQIQDDFLDFSGTPEQIGKIGTDIVDNKCSWVVNTALKLATPAQRQVLDENYGRKESEKEKTIKALFEEMGIRGEYARYEERAVGDLKAKIAAIEEFDGGLKRAVFESFLGKIYKRTK